MPRKARKKSESGIYHVMVRGINRQILYHDDEDCLKYLETLLEVKKKSGCEIFGYCIMDNHIHVLIKEGSEELSIVMKRLGARYVWWYNLKYERAGHAFQDRYKSECIENDAQLLTTIRYIHMNPVKAGIVSNPEDFIWSSCREYYGHQVHPAGVIDTNLILKMLSDNEEYARKMLKEFTEQKNDDICLEDNPRTSVSDRKLREEIKKLLQGEDPGIMSNMQKDKRNEILRKVKEIEGISIRQIARITGVSPTLVSRA